MNIAIYVDYFLPASETFIFDQIELLSTSHNVTVICKELNLEIKSSNSYGVQNLFRKRFYYRVYKFLYRKQWYKLSSKWISFFLTKYLRPGHYDVIICHFLTNALDFMHIKLKSPLMVIIHGYDGSQFLKSKKNQEVVNNIIEQKRIEYYFVSKNLKRLAQSYCPKLDGNTIFLGSKIWNRSFNFPDHQSEVHICQISRLVPKKGVDIAILAVKILLEIKDLPYVIKFKIIGSGPYEKELKSLATPYLNKNIFFEGELPHEQTLNILETAQIYLQPSIVAKDGDSDGLSISLIEAIVMDRWIISTQNSGVTELLDSVGTAENIFVCEPNPMEISAILQENIARFLMRPTNTIQKSNLSNHNQMQIIQSYGNLKERK
ncbi:MAG: glycosyltransferase [Saprospiraceae bacterium]|nr:glycosyltransferase [Saprospiraceae bacterium]